MNKQTIKCPFDDEYMKYDYESHRYILTQKAALDLLGEDLSLILNTEGDANPSTLPDRVLRRVSNTVYAWLYAGSTNADWLEYMLATYAPLRPRVRDMLLAQTLYVLHNGFVADYSGVNIAKGQTVDPNYLRGRARIAPEVEDIANRDIPAYNFSLSYRGRVPYLPFDMLHVGY